MTDLSQSLGLAGRQAPFLNAGALQPGAFATITDLAEPWQQDSLDGRDRIVIDDAEQERTADVKLVRPDLVHGDLSDLVLGRVPRREGAGERSAFIFRGYGLADLAIASLALVAAEKQMSVR